MPCTITLSGLPLDATVRELKNFCRLVPGFEAASATLRGGRAPLLFVKFFTEELASQAILQLQQLCFDEDRDPMTMIKAEFARTELSTSLLQSNGSSTKDDGVGSWGPPPAKRLRQEEHIEHGIDTLACRLDQNDDQIQPFFETFPGFVAFRMNPQNTNCFVKFASPDFAHSALEEARGLGLVVDFARKNLEEGGPPSIPAPAYVPSASTVEAGSTGSTLACRKEFDQHTYQSFFEALPGFEVLRYPQQGGSCFIKFASSALAQDALSTAREQGFTVEFARRELDESAAHVQHQQTPLIVPLSQHASHKAYVPANGSYGWTAGGPRTLAIKFDGHYDEAYAKRFFTVLPGFEAIKVAVTGGNCFVRYSDHSKAQIALHKATQTGFTLDFARRELEEPGMSFPTPVTVQTAAPRMPACNTLACKMEIHTEGAVQSYFEQCRGFDKMKVNAAGSNCFIKFLDQYCAQEALSVARSDGFIVDFAKRELDDSIANSEWGGLATPTTASSQIGVDTRISTLACKTNDLGERHMRNFFSHLSGFEMLKMAASGKVCFLKFSDPDAAEAALIEGQNVGLAVEFAKRELDTTL